MRGALAAHLCLDRPDVAAAVARNDPQRVPASHTRGFEQTQAHDSGPPVAGPPLAERATKALKERESEAASAAPVRLSGNGTRSAGDLSQIEAEGPCHRYRAKQRGVAHPDHDGSCATKPAAELVADRDAADGRR